MWRFVEDSAEAITSAVRREAAFLRMWWALQIDVAIGLVGTLVLSAALVSNGAITLGTAFLLFQYVHLMIRPLEELADQLEVIQKANGAMHRVVELLAIEPTVVDRGTTSPPAGPLSVSCRGVGFAYDEAASRSSTTSTSTIAGGRSVGVVGRTGSGKTTFSRLLLRLVEATHGTVALGGVPIADIPMAELRRRVALVPQEVELFEGTIRDNVTLFDPAPTDADVEEALRHVGLDGLVDTGHRPPARRRRGRAVGRAGPAPRPGPGVAAQPRPRRPRRGDGPGRPGDRAAHRRGDRRADEGTHDVRHRPSPVDARHGRRGDRVRPRADRRARRPHGAGRRPGQPLPPPPRAGPGGRDRRRPTVGRSSSTTSTRRARTRRCTAWKRTS